MKPLAQRHIDWLLAHGVSVEAMVHPEPLMYVEDGRGREMIYIPEDQAWWHIGTDYVTAPDEWCIGRDALRDVSTFALGNSLTLCATPLEWLQRGRKWSIHVLDWSRAYDELQNLPRVVVPASLEATYRKAMKPRPVRLPRLTIAA